MSIPILLFLVGYPGYIGMAFHQYLLGEARSLQGKLTLFCVYGFGAFWLSLLAKCIQGWGGWPWAAAFDTVTSLFKYGLLELLAVLAVPLALSFLVPLGKRLCGREGEGKKDA